MAPLHAEQGGGGAVAGGVDACVGRWEAKTWNENQSGVGFASARLPAQSVPVPPSRATEHTHTHRTAYAKNCEQQQRSVGGTGHSGRDGERAGQAARMGGGWRRHWGESKPKTRGEAVATSWW